MRKTVNINNNKTSHKISQKTSKKILQKIFVIFKHSVNSRVKVFNNAFKTFNKFKFYIMLKTSTNTQINCLNDNESDMHYIQSNDDDDIQISVSQRIKSATIINDSKFTSINDTKFFAINVFKSSIIAFRTFKNVF